MKKIIVVLLIAQACVWSWAQGNFGDIPKTVDYRDARITNEGVVAADIYQWAVEDSVTHEVDTVITAEPYILWESDGDLEVQANARRARGLDYKGIVIENGRKFIVK